MEVEDGGTEDGVSEDGSVDAVVAANRHVDPSGQAYEGKDIFVITHFFIVS